MPESATNPMSNYLGILRILAAQQTALDVLPRQLASLTAREAKSTVKKSPNVRNAISLM